MIPKKMSRALRYSWLVLGVVTSVALGQQQPPARDSLDELIQTAKPAAAVPDSAGVARPASLPPGELQWVGATTGSRAVRMTVHAVVQRDRYGSATAAPGRSLIIADVELENVIPLTIVYDKQVPTEYRVPNLADHLYLVIDGARVARLRPDADDLPGHVRVKDFKLERIGARVRGNVVFDAPAGPVTTAELRFYDYAHGHMTVRLIGPDAAYAAQAQVKPAKPLMKNEVLEAGVFALDKVAELNGQKAPAGMTFVVADFRARSVFTTDGDASVYDPKARAGAKMKIGTVAN